MLLYIYTNNNNKNYKKMENLNLLHKRNKETIKGFENIVRDFKKLKSEAVKSLIEDFDHFVDDAVLSDGRGHFLSSYDGYEHEVKINGNYYYIYRTN